MAKTGPRTAKAKPEHGTKSNAVREALKEFPSAGPTEIAQKLKEKGIEATVTLISNVKSRLGMKPKRRGKKRGRKPGRPAAAVSNGNVNLNDLMAAKQFASQVGSVEAAEHALKALAKLQ